MISHDRFRKSSFSAVANCVEVRRLPDGRVAVRDSKDLGRAPHRHSPAAWTAFLAGVRAREFGAQ